MNVLKETDIVRLNFFIERTLESLHLTLDLFAPDPFKIMLSKGGYL
jgi:hypothetical protein